MEQPIKPQSSSKTKKKAKAKKEREEELKAIKGDLDLKPRQMIEAYKNSMNSKHDQVMSALKNLHNRISGLNNSFVATTAYSKLNVPNLKSLKFELQKLGADISGIPDQTLRELVALDDWGTIWNIAQPLIKKFGPSILSHLYSTYVKPKVDKFMGGDEGINPIDWGGVLGPRRFTPVLGENVEIPGVKSVDTQIGSFSTVDPKSIASTLCPELFKHRYAYVETMKTALANISAEYSISTNASGQVGVLFFPLNVFSNGSTFTNSYITVFNDTSFTVTTGSQTPAGALLSGPLSSASASITGCRATNTSIQVIPTASFNTAGAFTLAYANRWSPAAFTASNTGTTLTQLKTYPFVTSFNNKTQARMVAVAGDSSDDAFLVPVAGNTKHVFILFGSGLPVNTEVARIVVSGVAEFIPDGSALPICVMDYPRIGPMTENFESMMFTRFPVLQQLDLQDARRISSELPENPTNFDSLMMGLAHSVTGVQPRQYVSHLSSAPIANPNESVEFAIE